MDSNSSAAADRSQTSDKSWNKSWHFKVCLLYFFSGRNGTSDVLLLLHPSCVEGQVSVGIICTLFFCTAVITERLYMWITVPYLTLRGTYLHFPIRGCVDAKWYSLNCHWLILHLIGCRFNCGIAAIMTKFLFEAACDYHAVSLLTDVWQSICNWRA